MDRSETEQWVDGLYEKIDAYYEEMRAIIKECLGKTVACLEEEKEPAPEVPKAVVETEEVLDGVMEVEEESAPEEAESVEEPQVVPIGATDEEAIGVTEDRSRNLRLAVRCRGRFKMRTKRDGRLRQECAATVGRPTRRLVPALRKGGLRKKPGKKCRSGIKRPSRTLGCRMGGGNLKKR
jgi:hypothetical protein